MGEFLVIIRHDHMKHVNEISRPLYSYYITFSDRLTFKGVNLILPAARVTPSSSLFHITRELIMRVSRFADATEKRNCVRDDDSRIEKRSTNQRRL